MYWARSNCSHLNCAYPQAWKNNKKGGDACIGPWPTPKQENQNTKRHLNSNTDHTYMFETGACRVTFPTSSRSLQILLQSQIRPPPLVRSEQPISLSRFPLIPTNCWIRSVTHFSPEMLGPFFHHFAIPLMLWVPLAQTSSLRSFILVVMGPGGYSVDRQGPRGPKFNKAWCRTCELRNRNGTASLLHFYSSQRSSNIHWPLWPYFFLYLLHS